MKIRIISKILIPLMSSLQLVAAQEKTTNSQQSEAERDCRKYSEQSRSCGGNYQCGLEKLELTRQACIRWIEEAKPKPNIASPANGGFMEKK